MTTEANKPVLYIDLDRTIVNFHNCMERIPWKFDTINGPSAKHPKERYNEAPSS